MFKGSLFLMFLVTLFVYVPVDGRSVNHLPFPVTTPHPKSGDVIRVEADKQEVVQPCRPGTTSDSEGCHDDQFVNVRTIVSGKALKKSAYQYTVTGGVIRGTGANVQWDMSGISKGTYNLTVAVKNAVGSFGKKGTLTISVVDCPDCGGDCACPSVSVSGPAADVEPGKTAIFSVSVSGGTGAEVTYKWHVSAGRIINGQGTGTIEVETTPEMAGTEITATVDIRWAGVCSDSCLHMFSKTITLHSPK